MHDSFILLDDFLPFFGRSFVPLPQNYNNEKQKRMKQIFFSLILSAATLPLAAMTTQNHNSESATAVQKLIFVPDSLKPYNLNDDNADGAGDIVPRLRMWCISGKSLSETIPRTLRHCRDTR